MGQQADVAIVGSGPYGLSLASQLRARHVDFRIFGPPMKFWRDMPAGINLKSFAFATNIWAPGRGHTFPEWCRARGLEDFEPCSMASFAEYGIWMQQRHVPEIDPVEVVRVAAAPHGGFELTLADERRVEARRVVFATGLTHLARMPAALSRLPSELATHTFRQHDYAAFRGKEVAVVGGGASAIEAGALVHEAGGSARIFVRAPQVEFHPKLATQRRLYERLRRPNSVIGPGLRSRAMQTFPLAIHFLPEDRRVRLLKAYLGPAAPWWIKDRVQGIVPIEVEAQVVDAEAVGGRARLRVVQRGAERTIDVDHVIAGTGYEPDVDRLLYLDPELRRRIRRIESAPALSMNFESSVPGAYFLGLMAALSFGPLFRFVAGGKYAAPALARHLWATRLLRRARAVFEPASKRAG